jgi:hypothetical protein
VLPTAFASGMPPPWILLEQLSGVFRLYRGAGLELLSRVIQLYNYYCIAIGAKRLSAFDAQRGALGGLLSGGKRDGLAWGLRLQAGPLI